MKTILPSTLLNFQNCINKVNPKNVFSAATYLSWSTFGVRINYEYDVKLNCIYLYCKYEPSYWNYINNIFDKKMEKWTDASHKHLILSPIVSTPNAFLNVAQKQIDLFLSHKKNSGGLFMEDLTNEQIEQLKTIYDVEVIYTNFSNYLYTREQLQFMAGKKMQKRRNHLNFYLNNYQSLTQVKKIKDINFLEIIRFLKKWGNDNNQFNYESELKFVNLSKELIEKEIFKGLGIFIDSKLIGLTISYEHNDFCEILVEHADKTKRGSYQYLLSQNLAINHPLVKWVDRQDDVWSSIIDFSKRMYHPFSIILKNVAHIKLKESNLC
ncbi:phosphatidylglycerol lysyltransferase domain-containing protein [Mycoplasmoides alvi]|uniref:phosphatidylglycerol lysyltransferase domain-containing protein n=1 Tax=Mycoplasmoides alvi TaxID=78580 RepID=UPI00051AB953|nr:phosphatidylglycerol lysyltransferase domain-containing protein [Mycoplasmoides alvi]